MRTRASNRLISLACKNEVEGVGLRRDFAVIGPRALIGAATAPRAPFNMTSCVNCSAAAATCTCNSGIMQVLCCWGSVFCLFVCLFSSLLSVEDLLLELKGLESINYRDKKQIMYIDYG